MVDSRSIIVSSKGVDIDEMVVKNRSQSLSIDGRASTSLQDTVRVNMHRFDLSVFTTLISHMGYRIDGVTNGGAVIASALEDARIEADIALDSVSVNNIASPNLRVVAQWDSKRNQARLHMLNRVNRDTLIRGYYIPSKVMYYARLRSDSVNLNLLDPPLDGILVDTKGYADLDIVLNGERRNATLDGSIRCYDMETTVGYTGARYSLKDGVITMNNNRLSGKAIRLTDKPSGGVGEALMDVDVDLSQLANIKYGINIRPRNMVVLNTNEEDNRPSMAESQSQA